MSIESPEMIHAPRRSAETAKGHPPVPGWGADLDPVNRPAVPQERTPPRLENVHWHRPEAQAQTVEVLQSIEHQRRAAVVGVVALVAARLTP